MNGLKHDCILAEGSSAVKLLTVWTDEKTSQKGELEEKRSEERRCRCAKRSESRATSFFFQGFVAPEGGKVGGSYIAFLVSVEGFDPSLLRLALPSLANVGFGSVYDK